MAPYPTRRPATAQRASVVRLFPIPMGRQGPPAQPTNPWLDGWSCDFCRSTTASPADRVATDAIKIALLPQVGGMLMVGRVHRC